MKYRVSSLVIVSICFLFTPGCEKKDRPASSQLKQLFADEWEFRLKENPLFATNYGDHRFDDKLSAVSEADEKRRHAQQRRFLERLQAIDRSALSDEEQLNYDIFKHIKENQIEWYKFQSFLMPITHMGGFHSSFPEMHERIPLNTVKDYENYIARLNAFKSYTEEHIELMQAGIEKGLVLPQVVAQDIEGTIKPHIVEEANQSRLFEPFEKFAKGISEADRENLTKSGRAAIMNSVVPAYQSFLKFITEEYVPASRPGISASTLPNGKEYYEYCVRDHTTTNLTPQEIHDIGLSEVKRIRSEMMKIINEVGFEGDFEEFMHFLRIDERFHVDTSEALLKEMAFVLKKIDGELPNLFKKLPRMPFGIKEVPDYIAAEKPGAYYMRPSGDGTRAAFYYINTYNVKSRGLYTLEALSLHEAMPGHHLQIALQQELTEIPNFRRFSWFTAYGEGWALYAEQLGEGLGLYQDPYNKFGQLVLEMWRACRLVVDTGIHYLGWSRQQAIDFMTEHAALPLHAIATEVDRYIVWPGQALAYKIGQLKILELRTLAEEKLGSSFDIREFHDVVLGSGGVPLDVLEQNVNSWLAEQMQVD
jgi:uncharacterized protein (DUF885 family)